MPIIKIDKSVLEEIGNVIERKDKMYEEQMATTKKLTDGVEKLYQQKVKNLEKENQRLNNIINEREITINNARKYIQDNVYYSLNSGTATLTLENEGFYELEEMLRIG